MQYQIRLSQTEMDWREFCILLHGIMPKTPLGMLVTIRSEEDKDILKHFTKEQHSIRNAWRQRNNPVNEMTEEEKEKATSKLQAALAGAFG